MALAAIALLSLAPSLGRLAWPEAALAPMPLEVALPNATAPTPTQALWVGRRLDLNTAAPDDLRIVHGIGAKLAERIVADREARGPFASVDEVQRVKGIGPKLAARLSPFVTVRGGPTTPRSSPDPAPRGIGTEAEGSGLPASSPTPGD